MELVLFLFLVAYACFWVFWVFMFAVVALSFGAMVVAYVFACCWLISEAGTWDASTRRTPPPRAATAEALTAPVAVAA